MHMAESPAMEYEWANEAPKQPGKSPSTHREHKMRQSTVNPNESYLFHKLTDYSFDFINGTCSSNEHVATISKKLCEMCLW